MHRHFDVLSLPYVFGFYASLRVYWYWLCKYIFFDDEFPIEFELINVVRNVYCIHIWALL